LANPEHLAILKRGVDEWNAWRQEHYGLVVDLSGADLANADLSQVNLSQGHLYDANFTKANVSHSDLSRAFLMGAIFDEADLTESMFVEANLNSASLKGATVERGSLEKANLEGASLTRARLSGVNLRTANLDRADLTEANLSEADLSFASLVAAKLEGANLTGADLMYVPLTWAKLRRATLSGAKLTGANLTRADLTNAKLSGAILTQAILVQTNLENADLTGARVYGVSAWDVKLAGTTQTGLVISGHDESAITVEDLEVAQFIYLLLNNQNVRRVIDTITSKVVLILGRFTPKRKVVLDTLRTTLRAKGYSPVVFDVDKPGSRDLTETISTLAHIARFVIADLTDAKSIPQELAQIVPHLPSLPVQPLLLAGRRAYSMFEHFQRYPWVLPEVLYEAPKQLAENIDALVIAPAEARIEAMRKESRQTTRPRKAAARRR
jgi:uncharacterized protein YjbI with pentapeptide repeats